MTKDPSFPFYASDWLGSTNRAMMTPEQRAAYIDLLCHQWNDPTCSLPDDEAVLNALSGLTEGWLANGSAVVRVCFPLHPGLRARLANKRLLELRAERDEWREKSRRGGRKSAETRRLRQSKGGSTTLGTKGATKGQPKGNTPSPSPSPKTKPPLVPLDDIDYPTGMDTPEVRDAITRWLRYKADRKESYKAPATQIGLLLKQDQFGGDAARFVEAIDRSMGMNWAGVFTEKGNTRGTSNERSGRHRVSGRYDGVNHQWQGIADDQAGESEGEAESEA